jgi:hypothetical protein
MARTAFVGVDLTTTITAPIPEQIVPRFKKELMKAFLVFGKRASGSGNLGLARHLKRASYQQNSRVWKYGGKGGKRVFYHTGAFRNAPSFQVIPGVGDVMAAVRVGIINDQAYPNGASMKKVAGVLAAGAKIPVTPAMRKAFWAKIDMKAIDGKVSKSSLRGSSKSMWTIPQRDFTKHLRSPEVINLFNSYVARSELRVMKKATVRWK